MSGAYSDTDDGGISRGTDHRSDSEYESTGMSDVPSAYDDTDFSDEPDLRPNSAPPTSTLFGVSMKKALSRPADRVEQAERKAERLDQERTGRSVMDTHNIFLSESELSVSASASGMSGSEMDRRSRHLSSLERIIANSDSRAQAKEREKSEQALLNFDEHNKT